MSALVRATEVRRLLREAARGGITLSVDGDRLRYQVLRGELSPEIRAQLQSRKEDLIAQLSQPRFRKRASASKILRFPQYWIDFWYETAANVSLANLTHFVLKLDGTSLSCLETAVETVCLRHDLLRGRIAVIDGAPCLLLGETSCVEVELIDLSAEEPPIPSRIEDVLQQVIWTPFKEGSIFRVCAVKTSTTELLAVVVIHHFLCDFPSCQILARELLSAVLHGAAAQGSTDRRPIQYSDYLAAMDEWMAGPGGDYRLAYWKEKMASAPVIRLPQHTDPYPTSVSGVESYSFTLEGTLRNAIAGLVADAGVTAATVMLAANYAALANILQTGDLVTILIASGRESPALLGLVGPTVNCFPVRVNVAPQMSYKELIEHVREAYLIAQEYQVPLALLMRALAPQGVALAAPTFNFIHGNRGVAGRLNSFVSGSDPERKELARPAESAHVDWKTHELNIVDSGSTLSGTVRYNPLKCHQQTVRHFVELLIAALTAAVNDPDRPLGAT